jgi:putative ABC transport system permease protein
VLTRGGVAKPSRWRWVADAIVILLAALSIVVLFQRGISGSSGGLTTDPLLVATPLLVSAAACALVLRAVPFVLRRLGRVVGRSRGVVGMVGRANSARAGARFLPVFAILTGVSVSIFAASILETEQTGIRDAAVLQVGADINITAPGIPESTVAKLRNLPGVAALAAINSPGGVNLAGQSQNISLFAVNGRDLAAVESVLPRSQQLFADLGTIRDGHSVAYVGGFAERVSAVSRFPNSSAKPIATVTVRADPPKFIQDPPWLLIDSAALPKDQHLENDVTNVLIRVAPGANQLVLERQVNALTGSGYTVQFADTQIRALTEAPLVGGLESLTLSAAILSLILCVLSLILALILGAGERAILLGRLGALGFSRRQGTGLVGWEVGPMTALGVVIGALVGIGLPIVFLAVVDLATFIGSSSRPPLVVDPIYIAVVVLAFAASAAIAVIVTAALSARRRQSETLRETGESP